MLEAMWVSFKLGLLSFGGPAAHLAMMYEEFVTKRGWVSESDYFTDMALTNLIPGPSSTQQMMAIGYEMYGWQGLIGMGFAFIIPPMLIVMAVTGVYGHIRHEPIIIAFLMYMGPALFGYITYVSSKMVKKHQDVWYVMGLSLVLRALGWNEISVLALVIVLYYGKKHFFSISMLFWGFLRIGATLYGSGYALLSYLVTVFPQLDYDTLVLAFTIGESTPGPIFTTATALGMMLAGPWGALASTLAIFLPSFLLIGILLPIKNKIQIPKDLLKTLNGAAIAFILYAILQFLFAHQSMIIYYAITVALMFVLKKHQFLTILLIVLGFSVLSIAL